MLAAISTLVFLSAGVGASLDAAATTPPSTSGAATVAAPASASASASAPARLPTTAESTPPSAFGAAITRWQRAFGARPQRGAQHEPGAQQQRGAQQEPGARPQHGAQQEPNAQQQKGAQQERGAQHGPGARNVAPAAAAEPATDAAPRNPRNARAADPAGPPAELETLHLGQGRLLTGQIVKETPEALFVDVGHDVVRVPHTTIVRREQQTTGQTQTIVDEQVFFRSERPELPITEGASLFGEAVVKIESANGQGSGFVTSPEGYIVTNFHVVERELDVDVTVYRRTKNGFDLRTVRDVKVVAVNPAIDLALLKMDVPKDLPLKHVFVGDSEKVKVGEQVYAIGTPIGLERTVSSGIVSVTNRSWGGHTMFQITTPINPGNSGGPLFNLRAEVVGVNSAGYMGLQGLNFAIPGKYVVDFLRNRDAFAVDSTRSENGIHYLPAPRKPGAGATGAESDAR